MVELVDTRDLKSLDHYDRAGSSPAARTILYISRLLFASLMPPMGRRNAPATYRSLWCFDFEVFLMVAPQASLSVIIFYEELRQLTSFGFFKFTSLFYTAD